VGVVDGTNSVVPTQSSGSLPPLLLVIAYGYIQLHNFPHMERFCSLNSGVRVEQAFILDFCWVGRERMGPSSGRHHCQAIVHNVCHKHSSMYAYTITN